MLENTTLGFCMWDIPALIVLIAIVAVFVVHQVRHKKRQKEFDEQLQATENAEKPTV